MYNRFKRGVDFLFCKKNPMSDHERLESIVEKVKETREFLIFDIKER